MNLIKKYVYYKTSNDVIYFNTKISIDDLYIKVQNYFNNQPFIIQLGLNLSLFISMMFSNYNIFIFKNFIKFIDNIIILSQVEKKN